MHESELVQLLNKEMALELPEKLSAAALQQKLSAHINEMILHRFEQLVSLLYRIDVSEAKIKSLLQNQPGTNAADIIAALIIERQLQKIKYRQQFSTPPDNSGDEEKW